MADIAVTVATEEVTMVAGRADVAVSVTNAGAAHERVVLRAFPPAAAGGAPAPADPAWASVDRPLRDVAAGATEQYAVALVAPASAAPGTYALKLVAHPADAAPEEYAERGRLLRLVVPAVAPAPPRRRPPWWVWAAAGALVVAVAVVAVVLLRGPTAVTVPDVVGLSRTDASAALADAGLDADVEERLGPRPFDAVTRQVPGAGTRLDPGSTVALVVSEPLALDGLQGLDLQDALALVAARVDVDVSGLDVAQAQAALADQVVVDVEYRVTGDPVGRVVEVSAPDSRDDQPAQGERLLLAVATTFDVGVLDDLLVVPDADLLDRILGR